VLGLRDQAFRVNLAHPVRFNSGSALRAAEWLSARLPIASDKQVFFCWMRLYVKRGHGKVRLSCGGHAVL
jgi:hypothetical protein